MNAVTARRLERATSFAKRNLKLSESRVFQHLSLLSSSDVLPDPWGLPQALGGTLPHCHKADACSSPAPSIGPTEPGVRARTSSPLHPRTPRQVRHIPLDGPGSTATREPQRAGIGKPNCYCTRRLLVTGSWLKVVEPDASPANVQPIWCTHPEHRRSLTEHGYAHKPMQQPLDTCGCPCNMHSLGQVCMTFASLKRGP